MKPSRRYFLLALFRLGLYALAFVVSCAAAFASDAARDPEGRTFLFSLLAVISFVLVVGAAHEVAEEHDFLDQ